MTDTHLGNMICFACIKFAFMKVKIKNQFVCSGSVFVNAITLLTQTTDKFLIIRPNEFLIALTIQHGVSLYCQFV